MPKPASAPTALSRRLTPAVGALFLIALVTGLAGCRTADQSAAPPPPTVSVSPVLFRTLRQWDDFTGTLEAVQSVEVRPRVSGYIDAVGFAEGARVRKGQLLFQIDPRPYQAQVERLEAELQRAEARAVLARADQDRGGKLIGQNAIAQSEFERLQAEAKAADADVGAARAALKAARLDLSFTHVIAPIDGRISKALITSGNLVATTSLLTTVVSDAPIYAAFNADEQTYLKYAAGQRGRGGPVFVGLIDETGFPHRGTLHFLDNAVDSGSGTIAGRALLDNADGKLTPGLFARVRLVSATPSQVALVPEQALGTDLGKRFVMVLQPDGHVASRPVELGPAVGELRVVRSGLSPGDQIVVGGLLKVKPGDPVKAQHVATEIPPAILAQLAPAG